MGINFANPDMVGHTGDFAATVQALEAVDKCLGEIINIIIKTDGVAVITADHGNAEAMVDEITSLPITSHSSNRVPFIIVDNNKKYNLREDGILADIAPTLLEIMKVDVPKEMTGKSLIVH